VSVYGDLWLFVSLYFMSAQDFITPLFPLLHKVRGAVRYASKGQLMLVNGLFSFEIYMRLGKKG
jgi:hypothetical protein